MARYPAMVRRRIIELYDQDYATAEIAEVFGVCESGVRRVRQRLRERGTLDPATQDLRPQADDDRRGRDARPRARRGAPRRHA